MVEDIVGKEVLQEFEANHMGDYLGMAHHFEAGKRRCDILRIVVKIPVSLNDIFEEKHRGTSIRKYLDETPKYKELVTMAADKLKLGPQLVKLLVEIAFNDTIDDLKSLFQKTEIKDVSTILMVGGFAESALLLELMKQVFPDKHVIVPKCPEMVVLYGAVILGYDKFVFR